MPAQVIEKFAKAPAPGFRCFAAGKDKGPRFVARVCHILHAPASVDAVAKARQRLGSHAKQVVAFYRSHDGFVLYRDTLSDAAGIELLPIEQWQSATDDM